MTSASVDIAVRQEAGVTGPQQAKRSFEDKLTYLIKTVHPPHRGPYSYREIAVGIADHAAR